MAVKFKDTININGQYTLPLTDGTDGQVLVTDGSGNLTFSSESIAGSADSAESTHLNVKNTSGASIAKGTPVYVTGSVGNTDKLEIAPADASNASHMPAIGLLESTLANNGEGFVVQGGLLKGLVTDTIDGSASTANDTVYVKAGGGLTLTKPTGSTNFIQNIAKVARVHNGNGSLIVSSILRTNDVPNLSTGKIWVGDSNTIESTVVHIDETNGRLGIGTITPVSTFHLKSDFTDANSTSQLLVENESSGESVVIALKGVGSGGQGGNQGSITFNAGADGTADNNVLGFNADQQDNAGSPDMVILGNGKIGIGTDSPSELLHIHKGDSGGVANNAADEVLVEGSGDTGITISSPSTNIGTLAFGDNDVSLREAVRYDHSNDSMDFRVSSNTRMTIDSSGNATFTGNLTVGDGHFIGDDSFDNLLLQAGGTGNLENLVLSASNDLIFYTGGTAPNALGTQRLRIFNSDGRAYFTNSVGIGTDSPSNDTSGLHIAVNSSTDQLYLERTGSGTGKFYLGAAANSFLIVDAAQSVERLRINSSGNLGIGQTNPIANLHIKDLSTSTDVRIEDSTGSTTLYLQSQAGLGVIGTISSHDLRFDAGDTERMRIVSGGGIQIPNVNATNEIQLTGTEYSNIYSATTAGFDIGTNSSSGTSYLRLLTENTERLRIDSSGRVGIGTTNPSRELDVVGVIQAQGNFKSLVSSSSTNLGTSNGGNVTLTNSSATDGNFNNIGGYNSNSLVTSQINFINVSQAGRTGDISFNTHNGSDLLERMRIDSSGRVGIGTDSPSVELEIASGAPQIRLTDTDGGYCEVANVSGHLLLQADKGNTQSSSYMRFDVDGSERMRIDSSGNVGIGTTSPAANLDILNGITGASLKLSATTTAYWQIQRNSTTGNLNISDDALGNVMSFDQLTGNVGIGTTSPLSKLHIENTSGNDGIRIINSTTGEGYIIFGDTADNNVGSIAYNHTSDAMTFDVNNSEKMRIDSSGNVGIGTTSPGGKLDIKTPMGTSGRFDGAQLRLESTNTVDTTGFQGIRFATSTTPNYGWSMGANRSGSGRGSFRFFEHINSITGVERFTIKQDGNVGINVTDPDAQLEIVNSSGGSYRLGYGGGTDSYFDSENFYIRSGNGGSNKLVVNSSGNVGIGTTSPSQKLTVVGNAYIAGGLLLLDDNQPIQWGNSQQKIIGNNSGYLQFITSNSERMRIDSSGTVQITKPATAGIVEGLVVMNPINTAGTGHGASILLHSTPGAPSRGVKIASSSTSNFALDNDMLFYTSASQTLTEKMRITSAGNVGIGTNSPNNPLHITSSSAVLLNAECTGASSFIQLTNSGGAAGVKSTSNELILWTSTSGTERLRIDSSGRVGIGTTSPSHNLTINSATGGQLQFQYNTLARLRIEADSGGGSYYAAAGFYHRFFTSGAERMRIDSSGRIGIGMTPSNYSGYMLQINGGTQSFMSFGNSTTGTGALNGLVIGNDSTGADIYQREEQPLRFHTNNTERMRIDSSGRVGIGTTSPGVALDVVGAIRATGDVTAFHSSDERLKANKKIIENATDKIEQIGGYEFDWVPKEGVHINEGHDIGVIAQEVEKVIPEVVVTRDNGYKAVKYEKLVPLLIEAVKELSEKVKILENK